MKSTQIGLTTKHLKGTLLMSKLIPLVFLFASLLTACGESESPQTQEIVETESKAIETTQESASETVGEVVIESQDAIQEAQQEANTTIANIESEANQAMNEIKENAAATQQALQDSAEAAIADIGDKPYSVTDGKISENALEGWRTYNGGGCGACHGKGGIGAVGPNLANSVANKLSKDDFTNIVTNGVSGTMMRPHKTNKRVMDNLDNLYIYLLARGDGVLGPGNLIKSPLGK